MALIRYSGELETQNKSVEELNFHERVDHDEEKEGTIVAGGVRGENGTYYFRPTNRSLRKAKTDSVRYLPDTVTDTVSV
jgi:hypothetical protein